MGEKVQDLITRQIYLFFYVSLFRKCTLLPPKFKMRLSWDLTLEKFFFVYFYLYLTIMSVLVGVPPRNPLDYIIINESTVNTKAVLSTLLPLNLVLFEFFLFLSYTNILVIFTPRELVLPFYLLFSVHHIYLKSYSFFFCLHSEELKQNFIQGFIDRNSLGIVSSLAKNYFFLLTRSLLNLHKA